MQKLSKIIISLLLAVFTALSMIALPSSAAASKINRTSLIVAKGYTETLRVSNASKVKWSSDNEKVATVDKIGTVTGIKIGTATISADTGKTVLKCKVSVKAGKITASANRVTLKKGASTTVSIKALGTHDLAVTSSDKSVARAAITGKSDDEKTCDLKISAMGDGTAKIKVYSKKYPDSVYMNIKVTAGLGKPVEKTSQYGVTASVNMIEVNENLSVNFTVESTDIALADLRFVSSYKSSFDVETSISAEKNAIDVKVNGFIEGEGNIRITSKKNSKLKIVIPVKVTNNTYDVAVWNREPHKQKSTDVIYTMRDASKKPYFILEPKDADTAHAASLLAKAADFFDYYTVYETVPKKQEKSDEVIVKTLNYKGERVVRYILAEQFYDSAYTESIFADYCGDFEYNVVYMIKPRLKDDNDGIIVYDYIPNGKTKSEKRYILSENGHNNIDTENAWEDYLESRENVTVL